MAFILFSYIGDITSGYKKLLILLTGLRNAYGYLIEATNFSDLFERGQNPRRADFKLLDAAVEPLHLLRFPVLRAAVVQDLDVG